MQFNVLRRVELYSDSYFDHIFESEYFRFRLFNEK